MSDNQSENSAEWREHARAHKEWAQTVDEAAVEEAVQLAQSEVWQAEQALREAKARLLSTKGRLWLIKDQPTWRQIFSPGVLMAASEIYTHCVQTGYSYACFNGRIVKVGTPGEQLIDTGATEQDIK